MAKVFDCIYGGPATGKSEACARLIEHVYRTTGKGARIIVGDGSALTYEHLVEAGVAEICEFGTREWPQDTLQKLTSGWWPHPISGELMPLGATDDPWINSLDDIGVYIIEGLSVAGAYIMGNVRGGLAERSGRGEKIGQDSPIRIIEGEIDAATGKLKSGPGTSFGGNPPSHYNVAQRTMLECLQRSKNLPVDYVLWTAHEGDNNPEKDLNKESLIGPEVVGKALTGSIQRNFNNTLHCMTAHTKTKKQDGHTKKQVDELDTEHRLYTRDHFAPSGASMTRYKACTRGVDETFPQYIVADKPGIALLEFYDKLAKERTARVHQLNNITTQIAKSEAGI